ncbi:MAG: TRAP transporter permease [Rhodospirillaceae bacterium]|nr:TRAP transporter permease [Rhodospirillaceae bacterium]
MGEQPETSGASTDENVLDDMIAEADTGARAPVGFSFHVLWVIPLVWSLFQLWYSSPLPTMLRVFILDGNQARSIHLAFAIFLTFLAFPATKRSPRDRIPALDWALALIGAFCAGYLYLFYADLADRPGAPIKQDVIIAAIGILVLLEATRRALGLPLVIVAIVFMIYTFAGPYMPEVIEHQGASLNKGMSHYWLTTEGVFGVALGVSTSMVFLFVLFGALLEKAGAGNYFIQVAFALLGHMRGGPAKAAVVSSGMTGLVSGSSIANVVTTGTFTIPLMRKVGFSAEKAGAIEVAASTNGQLTPPVMGAAAFLMIEFVGISYIDVIKHAFLPAIISYIALVYIVHLEAMKADMKGLPRLVERTWFQTLFSFLTTAIGMMALAFIVYYGLGWIKGATGDAAPYVATVLVLLGFVGLVKFAAMYPDLGMAEDLEVTPDPGPTVKVGLYFLLPVALLFWCLTVERLSPALSAFWATCFLVLIVITHKPMLAFFRGQGSDLKPRFDDGLRDLFDGLISGARNMIGIGVATATAGIVVGTITLTGIGQVMVEFIEVISGGHLMLILVFTAVICLVLGMGLPTTVNYIVVSSLMAPVVVELGAENGLIVPLIAVHMFVFYFGILADDTPPVGLAAFAAAAISGGDPIRTGIQGFTYDIRTAILPFMFIFNTELLMIGIEGPIHLFMTVAVAVTAMLVFAAATQGFFIAKSRIWESLLLLLVAFTFFRPGFFMDKVYPPLQAVPAVQVYQAAEGLPAGAQIQVRVKGLDLNDNEVDKVVMLPVGDAKTGKERILKAGLELRRDGDKMIVDNVVFGSAAEKQKIDLDWEIAGVLKKADRPSKQWMYIPAILLLGLIILLQRRRREVVS